VLIKYLYKTMLLQFKLKIWVAIIIIIQDFKNIMILNL